MFKKKTRRSKEFKNNRQVIDIEVARNERRRKRASAADKKPSEQKPSSTVTHRQAGKKARRRVIYMMTIIIILAIIGASIFNIISLKLTQARIEKEQDELSQQKARLENQLEKINSPEYIEQQARQQLRMIRPGEILYVLPEDKEESEKSGIIPE